MKNQIIMISMTMALGVSCVKEDECAVGAKGSKTKSSKASTAGCAQETTETFENNGSSMDEIVTSVDKKFGGKKLLLKKHSNFSAHKTDGCFPTKRKAMADVIFQFVDLHSKPEKISIHSVASSYAFNRDTSKHNPTSLWSNPLCVNSSKTIDTFLGSRKNPSSRTLDKMNIFANTHNKYRKDLESKTSSVSKAAKGKLTNLWGRFFSCLSYVESLTSAETSKSQSTAKKFGPSGYRKPANVKFYIDPKQSQASKLNVGLFQFTPDARNNIHVCMNDWNRRYSKCQIKNKSTSEMVRMIGSSGQHFNAFCGVNKIVETFAIQANTFSSKRTHPNNKVNNGLKAAKNRCVTPHVFTSFAYNHFGPTQNTTGSNLSKLMSCVIPN